MCDQVVKQLIVERVRELGRVTSPSASYNDLRQKLGISSSNTVFKRALGSAIGDELVRYHKPSPEGNCDDSRPISLSPGPAVLQTVTSRATPYSDSLRPYFVP